MPVAPLGFALQRFVPLAFRRHLSVRLPLVVLPAKDPPNLPSRCVIQSPGCAPYQRPTRHRVNMPAPTCVLARDVPGPSFAPVLWMGTSTRRALQRHSARRSPQQSFRRSHRPTGFPSGFPVERPRLGGRRQVSPVCARYRRAAFSRPEGLEKSSRRRVVASRRPVPANGHRSFRSIRLASAWSVSVRCGVRPSRRSGMVWDRNLPNPPARCRTAGSAVRDHPSTSRG